jgi:hypothetical protein
MADITAEEVSAALRRPGTERLVEYLAGPATVSSLSIAAA